jgi:hypothetical protein
VSRANDPAQATKRTEAIRNGSGVGPAAYYEMHYGGLTIREHFAAMALTGLCNEAHGEAYTPEGAATRAVRMADALLAELAKVQP